MNFRAAVLVAAFGTAALGQEPEPAAEAKAVPENLAANPGFEERLAGMLHLPSKWEPFASGPKLLVALSDGVKRSGERSLRIGAVGQKASFVGVVQQKEVVPKARYTFRAHLLGDVRERMRGGAEVVLSMEWLGEDGAEISPRAMSRPLGQLSKTQWKEVEVIAKPPPDATRVKFVVLLKEDKQPGDGALYVDDVEILVR